MLRQILRPASGGTNAQHASQRRRITIVVRDVVYAMTHSTTWPVDAGDVWRVDRHLDEVDTNATVP